MYPYNSNPSNYNNNYPPGPGYNSNPSWNNGLFNNNQPPYGAQQQQQYNSGGWNNATGYPQYDSMPAPTAGSRGLFDPISNNSPNMPNYSGNNFNQNVPNAPNYVPINNNVPNHQSNSNFNNYPPQNQFQNNNFYQPPPLPPQPQYNNFQGSNQLYPTLNSNINNQQMNVIHNPTVRPHQPFNPNDDAAKLYKAMKGLGTDETVLIDVLCKRTSQQRQQIALAYKSSYGKDLLKNLESETSGNFKQVLRALMFTPTQLEAHDLHKSLEGWGTDELSLIDIICTKTNDQMLELKNTYRIMFGRNMEEMVKDDVSGYFKRFLISLMTGGRSNEPGNPQKAVHLARELYNAGEGRIGTNEVVFNRIFASESFDQLRMVFDEYYKLTGRQIEQALRNEMSTSVERAFLTVALMARNPVAYYAQRLHESMVGAGTKDKTLIRTIVLRSEIDLAAVKQDFNRQFRSTLENAIKSDTSGDYKRALLCLAGDANWR